MASRAYQHPELSGNRPDRFRSEHGAQSRLMRFSPYGVSGLTAVRPSAAAARQRLASAHWKLSIARIAFRPECRRELNRVQCS